MLPRVLGVLRSPPLRRVLSGWASAIGGSEGARANVAAELAEIHARLLEVEALGNRLRCPTSVETSASRPAA